MNLRKNLGPDKTHCYFEYKADLLLIGLLLEIQNLYVKEYYRTLYMIMKTKEFKSV